MARRSSSGGIPSFESIVGKPKKGRAPKAAKLLVRYQQQPDGSYARVVFDTSDPEEAVLAQDALTPEQFRTAQKRGEIAEGKFAQAFAQTLGTGAGSIPTKITRTLTGKGKAAAATRLGKNVASVAKGALGPAALTFGVLGAAALGAYKLGTSDYRKRKLTENQYMTRAQRAQEKHLGRKLTSAEKSQLKPIWKQAADLTFEAAKAARK